MSRDLKTRIEYLDSLKAFGIALVVLGHICAGYSAAHMYPSAEHALAAIHKVIYMFHMPLFMTISGYVFYMVYFTGNGEPGRERIFQQALNLVAIYFLFSAMLGFFKMAATGYTNSTTSFRDILLIPVLSISPYWYLYVLVTLYFAFSAWDGRLCGVRPAILLPALAFLSVVGSLLGTDVWFELGRSLYYSFFFALGIALRRSSGKGMPVNAFTTPIFGIGASVLAVVFWDDGRHLDEIPLVNLVVGALSTLFFWGVFSHVRILAKNRLLHFVGGYSLEIFVLHCIFTAGQRTILPRLGVRSAFTSVALNLFFSMLLPVLFGVACKFLGVHGLLFRPVSYFRHKSVNWKAGRQV